MQRIWCSLLFLLVYGIGHNQTTWSLTKEKDGIRVYTQEIEGSDFKAFRAVTEIRGSLLAVYETLMDIENYVHWVPYTKTSKVLEHQDKRYQCYILNDAPWPVSDRDGFYDYLFEYFPNRRKATITIKAIPDFGEEHEGVVRITQTDGFWDLSELEEGMVKVIYQVHSDPGGSIPAWLAASSVTSVPIKTLKGLQDQIITASAKNDF